MKKPIDIAYLNETFSEVLYKMTKYNLERLPVISDDKNAKVLGQISRSEVINRMH